MADSLGISAIRGWRQVPAVSVGRGLGSGAVGVMVKGKAIHGHLCIRKKALYVPSVFFLLSALLSSVLPPSLLILRSWAMGGHRSIQRLENNMCCLQPSL